MSNESNTIRIVIADEQTSVRQSLLKSLQSEPDIQVLGLASTAHSAAQLTRQVRPDILLVDSSLSRGLGHALNGFVSQVRIVVMVTAIEKNYIVDAFRLGARGIVSKTSASRQLIESIRSVVAGQYWLESESVGIVVEALREILSQSSGAMLEEYGLTRRELDIITKIASGRSNKEVGEEFFISERTVKHHLTNIFSKVGVSSRLQLALFAVNHHLMTNQAPWLTPQDETR